MRFTRMPASVAIGGAILSAACSGNLLPTSVDGGYGLGSDSGSGVASSSGATSGASSVSLCEQFQQEELQNPMEIACPGGSYVPSMAVAADNGQCLVTYTCPGMPTASFPIQLQPTPSQPSSCTAASPDLCSACLALPQICRICSNGETECAHYVLQNGACEIEICPASPPSPASSTQPAPCAQGCPPTTSGVPVDASVELTLCPEGAPCTPTSVCTTVVSGCEVSCSCPTGTWECGKNCANGVQ